ncbi:hypothetical protein CMQ_6155 [Grosmannia clavigera kw1407]|uniref:BZIP domain-containing protein n=1 Tax=Grosmannia clavigera (strain kw1407 / UAMH 11150) TaxID=655863 RepID=F0XMB3_GROCL|nr:uncharacterized protein CMQ_6155 [Grosmannia clavigera kw1407]EFX01213.1 hypothetical protein CMQ_6155 [Grosmannia clavigera kw1407]
MSSSQQFQKDIEASSHRRIRQRRDRDSDELEEATGQTTSRASTDQDSGSDTETESPTKKSKKSRGRGKGKDKGKGGEEQQQQPHNNTMLPIPSRSGRASSSVRRQPSKGKTKTDDWSEVTDPEERRRIQNRIAQRKFREKAREQKERTERDQRNQEHAASSYQVPGPYDLAGDGELSGLPWGGPSLRFVVAKGHESLSNQGSRRASEYLTDEMAMYASASRSRRATEAAEGGAAEADAASYRYSDDSQLYFASGDGSQAGSSRSSSDFTYTNLAEDPQYFDESPYYYD